MWRGWPLYLILKFEHWTLMSHFFPSPLSFAPMPLQHPAAAVPEPGPVSGTRGGRGHQQLSAALHLSTRLWRQVQSSPSNLQFWWEKPRKKEIVKKSTECPTLISQRLCPQTTVHIISWWKENLWIKVKPQRLPSSHSSLVPLPLLWTRASLEALAASLSARCIIHQQHERAYSSRGQRNKACLKQYFCYS